VEEALTLFTIGHSTHTASDFCALLTAYELQAIVDIRTIPRSRYNPQFNKETLATALGQVNISYLPMPWLGGLRHTVKDSINMGLENKSFRGYADYMQTG
jgi:uncharacterized protein (DUF488 family)